MAKKKNSVVKIILYLFVAVFILIQFIRPDYSPPVSDYDVGLLSMTSPSPEIANLIRNACYDCHSNETQYPWYAEIAPVSWLVVNHVEEGCDHFNFNSWATYGPEKQQKILEECAEEVEDQKMPLKPYTMLHKDAKLDEQQRKALEDWFLEQGRLLTVSDDH